MGVAEEELAPALDGLLAVGVLEQAQDSVWPSSATRRLDLLGLIGV